MRVISKAKLVKYWQQNAQSEQALKAWHDEVKDAEWNTPQDIKNHYPSVSFLNGNRVCFNIKGNAYRLIVSVAYKFGAVYIKFIGTHAEYSKVDANKV